MGEERKLDGRDEGDWQRSISSHSLGPEEEQILALVPCSKSSRSGPEDIVVLMKLNGCEERWIVLGSQRQAKMKVFGEGKQGFGSSRETEGGRFKESWQHALSPPAAHSLSPHSLFFKTPSSFLATLLLNCAKGCRKMQVQRLNKINKQNISLCSTGYKRLLLPFAMAQSQNPEECAKCTNIFPWWSMKIFHRPIGALFTLPLQHDLWDFFTAISNS